MFDDVSLFVILWLYGIYPVTKKNNWFTFAKLYPSINRNGTKLSQNLIKEI